MKNPFKRPHPLIESPIENFYMENGLIIASIFLILMLTGLILVIFHNSNLSLPASIGIGTLIFGLFIFVPWAWDQILKR